MKTDEVSTQIPSQQTLRAWRHPCSPQSVRMVVPSKCCPLPVVSTKGGLSLNTTIAEIFFTQNFNHLIYVRN